MIGNNTAKMAGKIAIHNARCHIFWLAFAIVSWSFPGDVERPFAILFDDNAGIRTDMPTGYQLTGIGIFQFPFSFLKILDRSACTLATPWQLLIERSLRLPNTASSQKG